jgi:DNA-binding SARP family transcriptional activator/tetratricopeptide (TPR) repeat protein/DNA-binding CsgD family transcriptional regulator
VADPPVRAPLALRVLGELTATRDSAAIDLGGRRQRAVLAVLVIARGEAVSADSLAVALWGDDAGPGSTAALQSYVSHLRRRLEPDAGARSRGGVIVRSGPGYALRLPPGGVDAWEFEQLVHRAASSRPEEAAAVLEQSLALWRGAAYADYAFEPWAEAEVARLTELRNVARERLADARLATGDAALLAPELEALVSDQPLREERWRLLVLALYRAHRQADALAALRRARQTLADELGVDPGPALRVLEAEVLAQSPALDVPEQRAPEPPPPVVAPPDLVGREREMRAVAAAVDRVAARDSGVLLVEGAGGLGKTRLLTEAVRLATERGLRVLSARGSQLERSYGLGAARQLLEPCLVEHAARASLLGGAAASARGVFAQPGADSSDGSFAVLHGLYWVTVNLTAAGPLVLAVDDVQWCDTGSLRFLAYLVKRLEGLPVLVALTLRTGEQNEAEDLLAEIALDPVTTAVRPTALTLDDVTQLVGLRLGVPAPAFAAACHTMTGGNPLLLRQLLRALEVEGVKPDLAHTDTVRAVGSRAISSLVLMRLRRMTADATTAARAVAVLGNGATLPQVAALAELPDDRCAAALAALSRAEVLADDEVVAFVHPIVRDAVYRDVPAAERGLQHERAARVLQQHGATPEQVAAHLVLAPRRGDAATVAFLRGAARTAVGRGAVDSGVALLRRALDEPATAHARVEVLLELGRLEQFLDGPAAAAHLAEAYRLLDDDASRAEAAIALARTHAFASPSGVATAFARDALAVLPRDLVDTRQGLLALQRITGFMHSLEPAEYRAGADPDVVGDGDGARMLAAALAWEHAMAGQDRQRTVELARYALGHDRLLAVDTGLFWVVAANALLLADADVGDFWERARAHAHRTGSLFGAMSVSLWRGWHEWRRGELDEALHSLTESTEQQRMWRGEIGYAYIAAFGASAQLDRGDLRAARRWLDGAVGYDNGGEGSRLLREVSARALLEEGRPERALRSLDAVVDPLRIANPAWAPWRGIRATALHALGRTGEAVELFEEEVAALRRWGAPTALGRSLRLVGEVTGAAGAAALREAVELLAGTSAAVELARARLSLGRSPDVPDEEAATLLEQAADGAAACGAEAVLHDALDELRERGRSLDLGCRRRAAVSRTELRVADLAAQGLSEHEVAQRLFLTPGTVHAVLEKVAARVDG